MGVKGKGTKGLMPSIDNSYLHKTNRPLGCGCPNTKPALWASAFPPWCLSGGFPRQNNESPLCYVRGNPCPERWHFYLHPNVLCGEQRHGWFSLSILWVTNSGSCDSCVVVFFWLCTSLYIISFIFFKFGGMYVPVCALIARLGVRRCPISKHDLRPRVAKPSELLDGNSLFPEQPCKAKLSCLGTAPEICL